MARTYGAVDASAGVTRRWSLPVLAAGCLCVGILVGFACGPARQARHLVKPTPSSTASVLSRTAFSGSSARQPITARALSSRASNELASNVNPTEVPSHPAAPVVFGWVVLAGAVGMAASALLRAASHRPETNIALAASSGRDYAGDVQKLSPLRDLVLAKIAPAEVKTTGGLVLPEVMQTAPTSGNVVAVGPKAIILKGGECVLYSKFGVAVTELQIAGEDHVLLREADIIGVLPRSPANASDVPELKPLLDKILVKKDAEATNKPSGLIPLFLCFC